MTGNERVALSLISLVFALIALGIQIKRFFD